MGITGIDNLCMGCMSESGGGAYQRCGFDEGVYVPSPHQAKAFLNERVIKNSAAEK